MPSNFSQYRFPIGLVSASILAFLGPIIVPAQQVSTASVIQQVDAAAKARSDNVKGYSVNEHYAVYRSNDEIHPVAEMTVMTTYQNDLGKSYIIVSQSGSDIIRKFVLGAILDNCP
jgi:hypothetical protein